MSHAARAGVMVLLLTLSAVAAGADEGGGRGRWIGLGVGAGGGLALGWLIGGHIDPDQSADDLHSVLIGAGVGAAVGAAAGWYLGARLDERASRKPQLEPAEQAAALERAALAVDPWCSRRSPRPVNPCSAGPRGGY